MFHVGTPALIRVMRNERFIWLLATLDFVARLIENGIYDALSSIYTPN